MAFAVSAPTSSLLQSSSTSSSGGRAFSLGCISNSAISIPRNAVFLNIKCIHPLGFTPFAQWDGLKQLSTSISQYAAKIERRRELKGKGVYASLFGVGAPEVLVIGVVALLVFGPKGLAEVARNMGKTIRAFQPTIKELQEVSREFKSTLEREIGLDDDDNPVPKSSSSNTTKPPVTDSTPDIELEDPADAEVKAQANWLRGALDQLQQEQAEERQEESKNTESEAESQTPHKDTPEASGTAQKASSVVPPGENQDHNDNPLQETASAAPADSPTPKAEAEV